MHNCRNHSRPSAALPFQHTSTSAFDEQDRAQEFTSVDQLSPSEPFNDSTSPDAAISKLRAGTARRQQHAPDSQSTSMSRFNLILLGTMAMMLLFAVAWSLLVLAIHKEAKLEGAGGVVGKKTKDGRPQQPESLSPESAQETHGYGAIPYSSHPHPHQNERPVRKLHIPEEQAITYTRRGSHHNVGQKTFQGGRRLRSPGSPPTDNFNYGQYPGHYQYTAHYQPDPPMSLAGDDEHVQKTYYASDSSSTAAETSDNGDELSPKQQRRDSWTNPPGPTPSPNGGLIPGFPDGGGGGAPDDYEYNHDHGQDPDYRYDDWHSLTEVQGQPNNPTPAPSSP